MHNQNFMCYIYVEMCIYCSKVLWGRGGDLHFNPSFPKVSMKTVILKCCAKRKEEKNIPPLSVMQCCCV